MSAFILDKLLDRLWRNYKKRVDYAARYQSMVEQRGGKVRNDHIAFRTFNTESGNQPAGVEGLARIFTALGYIRKDNYLFADKKLTAWHYEHAGNPANPKIFISQLEVDQLSPGMAAIINKSVAGAPDLVVPADLKLLASLSQGQDVAPPDADDLAARLAAFFARPWSPPKRSDIETVDRESQYAAWTLLHGNAVNHFTAYINAQKVAEWPDIEATVAALREAGIPMKAEFEGEKGSKLRQSSTQAADAECDVIEADGRPGKMRWSYAYYELAERGKVPGPDGAPVLFQAFLGAQAANLFEMTKRN